MIYATSFTIEQILVLVKERGRLTISEAVTLLEQHDQAAFAPIGSPSVHVSARLGQGELVLFSLNLKFKKMSLVRLYFRETFNNTASATSLAGRWYLRL